MKNCARYQLIPDQLFLTWNQLLTHISIEINVSSLFTLVEVSTLRLVRKVGKKLQKCVERIRKIAHHCDILQKVIEERALEFGDHFHLAWQ